MLFVVSTPIGNLGDITLRALETLKACDRVAAEDTRRTRALLSHHRIAGKPLDALHAHSDTKDVARLVERLVAGEKIALVTDAGTPVVSDPGGALVIGAIAAGVRVVPIPGPSAVLAALVASGLAGDGRFRFMGFLPRDGAARGEAIASVASTPEAVILYEAPNRVEKTMGDLAAVTPERSAAIARELTKLHEEIVRGTVRSLCEPREWVGEVVIVLGPHAPEERAAIGDDELDRRIDAELASGGHAKTIAERLAAWSGRPRREVYERVVARKHR